MSESNENTDLESKPVTEPSGKVTGLRRARPCPICSKPSEKDSYPFCSQRCKDIDLGRWFTGSYAIPAQEEDDPDESDFDDLV